MKPSARQPAGFEGYILPALVVMAFLCGGSARASVQSLILLRPASAIVLGVALYRINRADLRSHRSVCMFAAAIIAVLVAYLIPLPPSVWTALPGRALAASAAASAQDLSWRPISLTPAGTRNALFSILVPMGAMLTAIRLTADQRARLTGLLLAIAGASMLLGVLQVSGPPHGPFNFYAVSNDFVPIGLFANRNHHAVFLACMIPVGAWYASTVARRRDSPRLEPALLTVFIATIVPTIIVSGSRAGSMLAAVALISIPLVRDSRSDLRWNGRRRALVLACWTFGVAVLVVLTTWFRANTVLQRIVTPDGPEMRVASWGLIWRAAISYLPVGVGWGGFAEAFQVIEPYELLRPTYFNHAHNDWLETVLTGGVVGVLLLAAAGILWLAAVVRIERLSTPARGLGRVGSIVILILGLASIADYPLRVPSIQCLLVIAALWMGDATRVDGARRGTACSAARRGEEVECVPV